MALKNLKSFERRVTQNALKVFDRKTKEAVQDGVQFAKNVAITKNNRGIGKVKGTLRTANSIKIKRNFTSQRGQIVLYYDNKYTDYVKGATDALANKIVPTRKSANPSSIYYDKNFRLWVEASKNDLSNKIIFGKNLYELSKTRYGITVAKNLGSSIAQGTVPVLPLKSGQRRIRDNIRTVYSKQNL